MTVLLLILDLVSFIFISLASIVLVLVVLEYFKGLKVPAFWIYIIVAFYLSITATFFDAAFQKPELTQATRLASNVFAFIGVYSAYKRMKTTI